MEPSVATRSLQRHGPLSRQLDDILGVNTDRSPRWTGSDTRRAAFQARAGITLHRGLGSFREFHAAQAFEQRDPRCGLRHLDDTIRTVFFAVATANTGLV